MRDDTCMIVSHVFKVKVACFYKKRDFAYNFCVSIMMIGGDGKRDDDMINILDT